MESQRRIAKQKHRVGRENRGYWEAHDKRASAEQGVKRGARNYLEKSAEAAKARGGAFCGAVSAGEEESDCGAAPFN